MVSWLRTHPFLAGWLVLGLWLTGLTYASYRIERTDQARARAQRAVIVAAANLQICNAINTRVLQPSRATVRRNLRQTARLLATLGFNARQVRAYEVKVTPLVARQLRTQQDVDCSKLATADGFTPGLRPPPPPTTLPTK